MDNLELALMKESPSSIIIGLPFIATFRAFDGVVKSCFGMKLDTNYREKIEKFSTEYRELGINVTPKVRCQEV